MIKYHSPGDIAEMKARGYDPATIAKAEEDTRQWREAQELCLVVEEAFAGVTLGGGVGLREAGGLDDYADDATLAAYRADDEKEDWRRISVEQLCRCHSSLSFFDAEGMRFHLPAYLCAELQGKFDISLTFSLTFDDEHARIRFALLNPAQRRAVRICLLFFAEDDGYSFERSDILRSLDQYWTEQS